MPLLPRPPDPPLTLEPHRRRAPRSSARPRARLLARTDASPDSSRAKPHTVDLKDRAAVVSCSCIPARSPSPQGLAIAPVADASSSPPSAATSPLSPSGPHLCPFSRTPLPGSAPPHLVRIVGIAPSPSPESSPRRCVRQVPTVTAALSLSSRERTANARSHCSR